MIKSKKSFLRTILALMLSLCMILVCPGIKGISIESHAEGADSIKKGDRIRFANHIWRVLDPNGVAIDSSGKKGILLLSEYVLVESMPMKANASFTHGIEPERWWGESDVRSYLSNKFENNLKMSDAESEAIITAVKDDIPGTNIALGSGLTGDRFFVLNYLDVNNTEYFSDSSERMAKLENTDKITTWWTRSIQGDLKDFDGHWTAQYIKEDGDVGTTMCHRIIDMEPPGIRPAFYLNPTRIVSVTTGSDGVKDIELSPALVNYNSAMLWGTSVFGNNTNSADAGSVYFGVDTSSNPIQWRIAGYDGKGAISSTGNITLISKNTLGRTKFNPDGDGGNYKDSVLHQETVKVENRFMDYEKNAITKRTLNSGMSGDPVEDALLWSLSKDEADGVDQSLRKTNTEWWTRTSKGGVAIATYYKNGSYNSYGSPYYWNSSGTPVSLRPATLINMDNILFLSSASNGKQCGQIGSDSLQEVGEYTGVWKMTLKSNSLSLDIDSNSIKPTDCFGNGVKFRFVNAKVGLSNYVSAIIVDKYNNIKYYGRIKDMSPSPYGYPLTTEMVSINLAGKYNDGDKLFVYCENINSDNISDSASQPIEVKIPKADHDWEFKGFKWTGNDKDGYTEAVARYECKNDANHKMDIKADISLDITQPTCTEEGNTVYTASVLAEHSLDNIEHNENKTAKVVSALGHSWSFEDFIWTGDETNGYSAAKAKYVCLNNKKETLELDAEISKDIIEPTCTENGKTVYTATITSENSVDHLFHFKNMDAEITMAKNHDWKFKGFSWMGDEDNGYTEVYANYECKNDSNHKDKVKAVLSNTEISSTCETDGKTTYLATISAADSLDGKEYSEEKDAKLTKAISHDWEFKGFTWIGDEVKGYTEVYANYECKNDLSHKDKVKAVLSNTEISNTCETDGKTTYLATISAADSLDGKEYSEEKDAKLTKAIFHNWEFKDFTWVGNPNDGYTSVVANFVCKNNFAHTKTVDAIVTEKVIKPTYEKNGYTEYNAKISLADSLDKSEHSEVKIAKETSKIAPPEDDDRQISGIPYTKMSSKGKDSLIISWDKTIGADGYDIFFARCSRHEDKTKCKKIVTIEGNDTFSWTKTGLKMKTAYKAYVKAYIIQNGKKVYVKTGPLMHAFTSGGTKTYTNAKTMKVNKKKVILKKGKKFKIKAKIKGEKKNKKIMSTGHAPKYRYLTTDKKVATVSSKGKIKAKAKGTCYVYVYAHNGVYKKIKVTVK